MTGSVNSPSTFNFVAAERAFSVYLKSRLKHLPPKDAAFVEDVYRRSKINDPPFLLMIFGPPIGINGAASLFGKMSISVEVPEKYRSTILPFIILAHEIEHVIQGVAKRKFGIPIYATRVEPFLRYVNSRYWEETGALRAQHDFLSAIPTYIRQTLIDMILNDPDMSWDERGFAAQMLESSFGDTEYFVEMIRLKSGYNRFDLSLQNASFYFFVYIAIYLVDILSQLAPQLAR